MERTDITFYNK